MRLLRRTTSPLRLPRMMRPGGRQATRSQRMDADSGLHSSKFPRWKVGVAWSADDHFWREADVHRCLGPLIVCADSSIALRLRHECKLRSYRNDAAWFQFAVALIIVALDVLKVESRCNALDPEQGAHVVRKAWIVGNPPDVAFEMADIDGIEPDQRREQPPQSSVANSGPTASPHRLPAS